VRIAVYHNLPPGGALRVLYDFVRRAAGEHEFDLYTVDLGRFDHFAYASDRAEPHDLTPWVAHSYRYPVVPAAMAKALPPAAWSLTAPRWMRRVQRWMAAEIDRRGYDVVFVHPCRVTHTPGLLRHLRTPSLLYMHEYRRRTFEHGYQTVPAGLPLSRRTGAFLVEQALRRDDVAAVRAADRIICSSQYTVECVRRAYGREATRCYPGVDTDVFGLGNAPNSGPPAPGHPTVLSVGALDPSKGHHLVVQALALLPADRRPPLDLVYERVEPGYRREVEVLAAAGEVELRLHAGISDGALARLYQGATATVVAAQLEPLGLVPLESMACGTPVVAVREAGYRETVVDGVNGYLVDRSASDIADALGRVLTGSLGRSARQIRETVVDRWSWDVAVKRQIEQLAITATEYEARPRDAR
jgi:glycosyltransferase involved in cell wall biosynthesis